MNLKKVEKALQKKGFTAVIPKKWRKSIILEGQVQSWNDKIQAGYLAVGHGFKGVVNDIEVPGIQKEEILSPQVKDQLLEGQSFDVVIVGGGVIGCSIARELSRYQLKIALFEKEEDLAKHASSRNDGMIHPAFAATPGSKKALYNAKGNLAYDKLCNELKINFKRPGNLILFNNPLMHLLGPVFKQRAKKNRDHGYQMLSAREVKKREPNVCKEQRGGFYLPNAGILSPYQLTIALAENAIENKAQVFLNTMVNRFDRKESEICSINTNRGQCQAKVVVNAAGIWADHIAQLADDRFFSLHGRKGMDVLLDINTGKLQNHITALVKMSQLGSKTKGGGIIPTIEGNLLIGPTAKETPYREDYSTEQEDLLELLEKMKTNRLLKPADIITYFSGIRACTYEEDFIVEPSETVKNLVHAAGIQSPGLASAPAIAEDIAAICVRILERKEKVEKKIDFNPHRNTSPRLGELNLEQRSQWIQKNPAYGRIVCRCEVISEGEIRDALASSVPVLTLDGIKRRTRAGMGRCHGGFCTPRILEIMAEENQIDMVEITKKGGDSQILAKKTKDNIDYQFKKTKNMKN
ncbi:MAG: NAD(P)/FAD-dependent oxidoreductase [Spirochaetes bacterium]|nr:NAD(P)/FAD-dependent oxidoreductase [Spirochaetota bacterium]